MKRIFSFILTLTAFVLFLIIIFYVFGLKDAFLEYFKSEEKPSNNTEVSETVETPDNSEAEEDTSEVPESDDASADEDVDERLSYDERIKKGNYFLGKGFLSLAVNEFAIASQLEPQKTEPLLKLGNIHFLLGNYEKARQSLEKILEIDENNIDVKVLLGKIYIKKNNFLAAKDYFSSIPQKSQLVLYYLGLLEIVDKNYELSEKLLREALEINSDSKTNESIKNFLTSFDEFNLYEEGDTSFLIALLAKSFNQSNEFEMSVQVLRDVLKQKGDYRDAWILLGYAYLNLEKYDFALTAFDKAYKLDSEKAETQYFLGITYFELGEFDESITYFEVALKNGFEPRIQIIQRQADIYLKQNNYKGAVSAYEEILELNDTDITSFVKPIWIYIDYLNNPEKALELSLKAKKKHPKSPMSYNLIGWSYLGLKKYDLAIEHLEMAVKLDDTFAAPYLNLGKVYEQTLKKEEALKYYKKAYEMDNEGNIGVVAAKRYNELVIQE